MLPYVFMYTLTGCCAFSMVAVTSSAAAMMVVEGRITCSNVSR